MMQVTFTGIQQSNIKSKPKKLARQNPNIQVKGQILG